MAGDAHFEAETFGDLLRTHRLARHLTQEALAERAGLSARGISDLERGARTQPYRETLRQLIVALGLDGAERTAFVRAARGPSRPVSPATVRPPLPELPIPLDRLVGREAEVAEVAALIADEATRLVTLTGPGGVGKTRLALAVAEPARETFPDGVAFVDLAPLRDPALVPEAVAAALGLNHRGAVPPLETLRRALPGKRMLLVLDNFEHLLAAGPVVTGLLRTGPAVKALVTSREPLRLRGEREYPVRPLAVPDLAAGNWREESLRSESVRLFVLRAAETETGFALTDENAAAVVGICRELDGLPLAIELAAPRIKVLPAPALLARLEQRLPLLTGGSRDAPPRQRTLRDAIAWSYDLLSPDERTLFRRLAVFLGGFTLDAADRVLGVGSWVLDDEAVGVAPAVPDPTPNTQHPAPNTLDLIASLVDKSLVRRDDLAAETRFSMLETIREFAAERLREDADEAAATGAAHARLFLALAEAAHAGLIGAEQADWFARLDAEEANIRAALAWAIETGQPELALRGARSLWRYWAARGRLDEGRGWLERALALPGAAAVPHDVRADAHNALGNLLGEGGAFTHARAHYEEALALRRELGDDEAIAGALNNLGLIAAWLGDYDEAAALHVESLERRQGRRDPFAIALSLSNLGDVHMARGDFDRARELQIEAMRLRDEMHDALGSAYSRYNLGEIARLRGDTTEATSDLTESLRRFEALGDRLGIAYAEASLGALASRAGDAHRAAALLGRALATRTEIGDRRGTIECLEAIAIAAIRQGDAEAGRELLASAHHQRTLIACPLPPATGADHERELGAARGRQATPSARQREPEVDDWDGAVRRAQEILESLGRIEKAPALIPGRQARGSSV
jgi:predicted ATPase